MKIDSRTYALSSDQACWIASGEAAIHFAEASRLLKDFPLPGSG